MNKIKPIYFYLFGAAIGIIASFIDGNTYLYALALLFVIIGIVKHLKN